MDQSLYNELKAYLDHYLGLLTSSDGKVNSNPIDKVSSLNVFCWFTTFVTIPKFSSRTFEIRALLVGLERS